MLCSSRSSVLWYSVPVLGYSRGAIFHLLFYLGAGVLLCLAATSMSLCVTFFAGAEVHDPPFAVTAIVGVDFVQLGPSSWSSVNCFQWWTIIWFHRNPLFLCWRIPGAVMLGWFSQHSSFVSALRLL